MKRDHYNRKARHFDGLAVARLLYSTGPTKENASMDTKPAESGIDREKERSKANQAAIEARTERRGEVRRELSEAEHELEALERMPRSSNETLERLTADITMYAERYVREVRHRMSMKGHMSLEDLKLESMGAQCHFSPNRVREGIKRLFPGESGIAEAERQGRRNALNSRIVNLRAELARLGG